nr:hypothetical protein TIFTF001_054407 [Ficus carica]GMN74346.1 hypothetical protein TIFTF001_054410 [Ficus carica]
MNQMRDHIADDM